MKHSIITRINFDDVSLLKKYLEITKNILIPQLHSQTSKNFEWIIITNTKNQEILKSELTFPYTPMYGNTQLFEYLINNNVNIQTRHDCDDFMASNYVETIQKEYLKNYKKFDCFLIQAQPTKFFLNSKQEVSMSPYHDMRCSMFLSICQRVVKNHIFERKHGQMYEITKNIITLPEGYTKWIIHKNNKSFSTKK